MTPPPDPAPKDYLVTFIFAFNAALVLLDTVPPSKPIQRGMATAIAMSDEIKQRFQTANETDLKAMIIVSRQKLNEIRGLIQRQAFPIRAMKARREWTESGRQLLKNTENIHV